jgi:hypothetical protein
MAQGAYIIGSSGNQADVTSNNELKVQAPTGIKAASLLGDAYSWTAVSANIDTTDCMILVSNTSETRNLVIHKVIFEGDIVGTMTFKLADCTGLTLAGTAITGINLNTGSNKSAPASAFSDETASPATSVILTWAQSLPYAGVAGIMNVVDLEDAIIVTYNWGFGIDTILEPAAGFQATVIGYYIDV